MEAGERWILVGDLNARLPSSGYTRTERDAVELQSWLDESAITTAQFPTKTHYNTGRGSWTTPDNFWWGPDGWSDEDKANRKCYAGGLAGSDHVCLFNTLKLERQTKPSPNFQRTRWNFKKCDKQVFRQSLRDQVKQLLDRHPEDISLSDRWRSEGVSKLAEILHRATSKSTPRGSFATQQTQEEADPQTDTILSEMDTLLNNKDQEPEFHDKLVQCQAKLREHKALKGPSAWYEDVLNTGDSRDAWRVFTSVAYLNTPNK